VLKVGSTLDSEKDKAHAKDGRVKKGLYNFPRLVHVCRVRIERAKRSGSRRIKDTRQNKQVRDGAGIEPSGKEQRREEVPSENFWNHEAADEQQFGVKEKSRTEGRRSGRRHRVQG